MRPTTTAVLAVSLLAIGTGTFAADPLPCARLLTAAEVTAAAGPGFKDLGQESSEAGQSECIWLLESAPNPKAVAFRFWQKSAPELPAAFESQAKKAEQVHGTKREVLNGVGTQAAVIPGKKPGAMHVLVMQTGEGVAYVETDYLERAQVLSLAKAIAAR